MPTLYSREAGDAHVAAARGDRSYYAALVALVTSAGLAAVFATSSGIGLTPDSIIYLDGARHVAAGDGFIAIAPNGAPAPVTHFPPLYSFLVAALLTLGLPVEAAARCVAVAAFAALVGSIGWVALRTARSRIAALISAGLLAFGGPALALSERAWTDVPALVMLVWTLYFLRLATDGNRKALLAGAAFAGAGVLLRYAGVVAIGVGGAVLLVRPRWPWRRRLGGALTWTVVSAVPLALWLARNRLAGGSATNRTLAWHPLGAAQVLEGMRTVAFWLVPDPSPHLLMAVVCALVAAWLIVGAHRRWQSCDRGHVAIWGAFAAAYLLFLAVSISLVDAATPTDARLLSPLLPGLYLLVGVAAAGWAASAQRRALPGLALALGACVALFGLRAAAGAREALATHRDARGYAARAWSAETARIRSRPWPRKVYTNDFYGGYRLLGRPVEELPAKIDGTSGLPNPQLARQLDSLQASLRAGAWLLVLPESHGWPVPLRDVERLVPLRPVYTDSLMAVYAGGS